MQKAKFRGISKKTGQFIYGMPNYDYTHIFNSDQMDSPDNYEVIPNTIGQLAESIDSIYYEGDVFKSQNKVLYIIKWEDSGFIGKGINSHFEMRLEKLIYSGYYMGNIHQNPELLK